MSIQSLDFINSHPFAKNTYSQSFTLILSARLGLEAIIITGFARWFDRYSLVLVTVSIYNCIVIGTMVDKPDTA